MGEERFNWWKAFGGGKSQLVESIWWRKDLIGGQHLGEERFSWWKALGEEILIGGGKI